MAYDQDDTQRSGNSSDTDDNRRRFLAGSAGAIGALGIGSAFGAQSVLGGDDDDEMDGEEPMEGAFEDDIAVLNFALTLEYLEAAFYRRGLNNLDKGDLMDDHVEELHHLDKLPKSYEQRIYDQLGVIQEHEEIHAETLVSIIEDRGGEPIDEPEFDFGTAVEDPVEFIQTAAVLEDTGVGAYAGAAPAIEDQDLVPPALSIHSVEGRHASFVRELGGQIGFPDVFDEALSKDEVLAAASQFIVEE